MFQFHVFQNHSNGLQSTPRHFLGKNGVEGQLNDWVSILDEIANEITAGMTRGLNERINQQVTSKPRVGDFSSPFFSLLSLVLQSLSASFLSTCSMKHPADDVGHGSCSKTRIPWINRPTEFLTAAPQPTKKFILRFFFIMRFLFIAFP